MAKALTSMAWSRRLIATALLATPFLAFTAPGVEQAIPKPDIPVDHVERPEECKEADFRLLAGLLELPSDPVSDYPGIAQCVMAVLAALVDTETPGPTADLISVQLYQDWVRDRDKVYCTTIVTVQSKGLGVARGCTVKTDNPQNWGVGSGAEPVMGAVSRLNDCRAMLPVCIQRPVGKLYKVQLRLQVSDGSGRPTMVMTLAYNFTEGALSASMEHRFSKRFT